MIRLATTDHRRFLVRTKDGTGQIADADQPPYALIKDAYGVSAGTVLSTQTDTGTYLIDYPVVTYAVSDGNTFYESVITMVGGEIAETDLIQIFLDEDVSTVNQAVAAITENYVKQTDLPTNFGRMAISSETGGMDIVSFNGDLRQAARLGAMGDDYGGGALATTILGIDPSQGQGITLASLASMISSNQFTSDALNNAPGGGGSITFPTIGGLPFDQGLSLMNRRLFVMLVKSFNLITKEQIDSWLESLT